MAKNLVIVEPAAVAPEDRLVLGTDIPRVDPASPSRDGFCNALLGMCMAED